MGGHASRGAGDSDADRWTRVAGHDRHRFNGGLEIPDKLRKGLNAVFIGRDRTSLAGGITIDEDYYYMPVAFDEQVHDVEVTFAKVDRLLIGTALLASHRLDIDFPARTVRLERVANS